MSEENDAKLSSEKRKKLPDSAFCGKKDRSFPAHDCAHVRAGFRLLARYKGPSSKSAIKSCLERKNKQMNCGVETDNLDEYFSKLPPDELKAIDELADSDVFENTRNALLHVNAWFSDVAIEEEKLIEVKESAVNLLDAMRQKRTGVKQTHADSYKQRSLNVVLDLLLDEIKIAQDTMEEPGNGENNTEEQQ